MTNKEVQEISEKTFIKLSIEKFFTFLISAIFIIGSCYVYTTSQALKNEKQDHRILIVESKIEILEKTLNEKMDKILENQKMLFDKQSSDHEFIIKHEYINLNKRNK